MHSKDGSIGADGKDLPARLTKLAATLSSLGDGKRRTMSSEESSNLLSNLPNRFP